MTIDATRSAHDDPLQQWHPVVRRLVTRDLAEKLDDLKVILTMAGDELDRDGLRDVRDRLDDALTLAFLIEEEAAER